MARCTKCGRFLILSTSDGMCRDCRVEKEIERQRIDRERASDEMVAGKEKVIVSGLYESQAKILECYAEKYGYKEDVALETISPRAPQPQKFTLIFTKTPLSKVSQMLGIPQDNMSIIRIDLANMVQCQYCKTTFDLNQQPRCPNCGGTSKVTAQ